MALRSRFPDYVEAVTSPIGRGLARTRVTPNWLTTFGLVLTGAATWAIANGEPVLAAGLLIGGGLMDLFDGAVARATGRSTPFGGFYDSVSDTAVARPTPTASGSPGIGPTGPGPTTDTSWPRSRSAAASADTWAWTPPGTARAYGETSATLTGRPRSTRRDARPTPAARGPASPRRAATR